MSKNSELVARVQSSPELALVFQRLWEPSHADYRRLFFAHRELIFPHLTEGTQRLTLPCLFAGSDSTPEQERALETCGESRDARREAFMRGTDSKAEALGRDLTTALCLLALRFVERNPSMRALLDEGVPTFARVAKAIAAQAPNFELLEEFDDKATEDRVLDGVLRSKVAQYSSAAKDFFGRGGFVDFASSFDLSLQMLPLLSPCRHQLDELLEAREIDFEEYETVLTDLYRARLISNVGTIWWCVRCQDDMAVLTSQSRVSPSQLGLKCPKCQRPMVVGALYKLDETLRDALFSHDGILGVAIACLLTKRGVAFEPGTYAGDQELDFRFKHEERTVLLECKMHKTNRDPEATVQHLVTDINQAARHAIEARKSGPVDATWIVTNYELASIGDELRAAVQKCREKVDAYSIEVVDAGDLPGRLQGGR